MLTLKHLAVRSGVQYREVRSFAKREHYFYHDFHIKKRAGGKRVISVPRISLKEVQTWIDQKILRPVGGSEYAFAFEKGKRVSDCAEKHLGCRWLIKIDLKNFFESISEIQVFHYLHSLGYTRLLSFEMARICTKAYKANSFKYHDAKWVNAVRRYSLYRDPRVGHLPQGAPTSPRLANAVVRKMDEEVATVIDPACMVYTRYADDLVISVHTTNFSKSSALDLVHKIYRILPKYGLRPNLQKTSISPPGARKVVLGLLVEGERITLPKEFRSRLECHLFFCVKNPVDHAAHRGFQSVLGLKNHIEGLLAYVRESDSNYYTRLEARGLIPSWDLARVP